MDRTSNLLTKVIEENVLGEALELGFSADFIRNDAGKEVFAFVVGHADQYGKAPSRERVKKKFKHYELRPTSDSLAEIIADMRDYARFQDGKQMAMQIGTALNDVKASKDFAKCGQDIIALAKTAVYAAEEAYSKNKDLEFNSTFVDDFKKDYALRQETGLAGIPFPWPTANQLTGGIEDGDIIAITGRPGTKKTTILVDWATFFWQACGLKVLFVSNELTLTSLAYREVARVCNIDYGKLRTAQFEDFDSIEASLRALVDVPGGLIVTGSDDDMGAGGVAFVESKVVKHRPDVILIDGAYLLDDDLGAKDKYQRAGNIVRSLKTLNKRRQIPIVITWQLNRGAQHGNATTANIGLTDVLSADASYIIALEQTADMEELREMIANAIKTRNSGSFSLRLNADFRTMDFTEIIQDSLEDEVDIDT